MITPGGNPVCEKCGHWYFGKHTCQPIDVAFQYTDTELEVWSDVNAGMTEREVSTTLANWRTSDESDVADDCWCADCDQTRRKAALDAGGSFASYICRFMIVCPDCGNKRCPRATSHGCTCTGSNEPGQLGSRYA